MNRWEKLQASNAWDKTWNLPLVPTANNPWIYMAYAFVLARGSKPEGSAMEMAYLQAFLQNFRTYAKACDVKPAVFDRFPGKRGNTSHDEAMGRAVLDPKFAEDLIQYLTLTDGYYDSSTDRDAGAFAPSVIALERNNWGRFLFLDGFLRACSTKYNVGLIAQLKWCLHVLVSAFNASPDKDSSGILKIWLMGFRMTEYFLPSLAFSFWAWRLKTKYGTSPKELFTKYHLVDCPIFAELAPESFTEGMKK